MRGDTLDETGSIPACAGEPIELLIRDFISKVYPRLCGGTHLFRGKYR